MIQKNCNWPGGTIHYKIYGEGVPVVLLHGFGEDSSIWNRQVEVLQNHCQLIVPDLPGTGSSRWDNVTGQWSMVNEEQHTNSPLTIDHSPLTSHVSRLTPSIDSLADSIFIYYSKNISNPSICSVIVWVVMLHLHLQNDIHQCLKVLA